MEFNKDLKNKKIYVKREFNASPEDVWNAWTNSELLDQWWAPKPWKAKTKSMDFREGGSWLYAMVGPDGTENFARVDYEKINPYKSFAGYDSFCDKKGNINTEPPGM
ncbi:MAG: SRPBCC domain-containing protein, partial [Ignavibacteriales bacterium]